MQSLGVNARDTNSVFQWEGAFSWSISRSPWLCVRLPHSGLDFGSFLLVLPILGWAGISPIPSCCLWQTGGNPRMPSRLCYVHHIPPALNLLGGENSVISPNLYSSFPLEALPRMLLSLCMVSAQLGEVTLLSLCGFSGQSCRDPRPGELLTPSSPRSLEPLLGLVSSMANFETFLKGISYKQMGIWKVLS